MHAAPPGHLNLVLPASDPIMPWTGMAFGLPVMAFYYWCTNQVIVQRMLAAKSTADGQKGALFAGFLKLLILFLIILPGVAGLLLYPRLASPDEIYLRMAFGLMPTGLLGLLIAAFLGALMAQLSAAYNSAATLVTMDFVRRLRPGASDASVVRWGRISTIVCMVISALWAPQIVRFPSLWQYFQAVLAYATPPAAALFLLGMLWPRANGRGAIWAVAAGSGLGLVLFALSVTKVWPLPFLDAAFLVFVISLVALVLASLTRRQTPEERALSAAFTLKAAWDAACLGSRGVVGWAVALLAVTTGLVWWFR
jgi:SSS family solute:Na+ symporter